jgi:hypothetical protein
MAGMVPNRRSQREIEQANQELLDRNRSYMKRWRDRASKVALQQSDLGAKPEDSPGPSKKTDRP